MGTKQQYHFFGKNAHRLRAWKKLMLVGAVAACLLPQSLLAAITSDVTGGVLTVTSDADDDIVVSCVGGSVKINSNDPQNGAATCGSITEIAVTGGPDENLIDLSLVDSTNFTSTITVTVSGAGGSDIITGTFFADTLNGGDDDDWIVGHRGADTMNGDGDDDQMVWNPGDGSDVADGGTGNDTMIVNGGTASETFTISATTGIVLFERTVPTNTVFSVDIITTTENLLLNGNAGNDTVTGTTGLSGVITITVNGGPGDDLIKGGDGPDILNGDDGNDDLIGFRGADTMNGGNDDDAMTWNPGDGSDIADGGAGNDTMIVNGGTASETFTISATPGIVFFERTVPANAVFSVDIVTTTENLLLNGNAGDETVTGTTGLNGVIAITVNGGPGDDTITGGDGPDTLNGDDGNDDLVGFRGADTMNGGPDDDSMTWNPGDGSDVADGGTGDDLMIVNGGTASETFTISATPGIVLFERIVPANAFFSVDIITTTERLLLNGNGGGDIVTGTTGLSGVITMTVNGGPGNDLIKGGDGPDTLNGDEDNDTLIGFRGPDTMNGGPGDDTMVWNNGDGSDIMDGGEGDDVAVVNGSPNDESFVISPTTSLIAAGLNLLNQGSVFFQRLPPGPFSLDIEAERVEVNGNDGNDTFTVTPLEDTGITYNGGAQTTTDALIVNALGAVVNALLNQILVDDKAPITLDDVEEVDILGEALPTKTYLPWTRRWVPDAR
jgi:Ca2+-binding RTX toxin-like protein